MKEDRLSKSLSGIAGVYFATAELSRRGFIATPTVRNTRGIDILAANATATRSVAIQVKTNQGQAKKWLLQEGAETLKADNLFYILVNLNGLDGIPAFHVVESLIVAEAITKGHRDWLAATSRKGGQHKDNPMRVFQDQECEYLNAWHRLGLESA